MVTFLLCIAFDDDFILDEIICGSTMFDTLERIKKAEEIHCLLLLRFVIKTELRLHDEMAAKFIFGVWKDQQHVAHFIGEFVFDDLIGISIEVLEFPYEVSTCELHAESICSHFLSHEWILAFHNSYPSGSFVLKVKCEQT